MATRTSPWDRREVFISCNSKSKAKYVSTPILINF
jgi:hypothetical protein